MLKRELPSCLSVQSNTKQTARSSSRRTHPSITTNLLLRQTFRRHSSSGRVRPSRIPSTCGRHHPSARRLTRISAAAASTAHDPSKPSNMPSVRRRVLVQPRQTSTTHGNSSKPTSQAPTLASHPCADTSRPIQKKDVLFSPISFPHS